MGRALKTPPLCHRPRLICFILAVLPPLVAFVLQGILWTFIKPYVWFLFFPAVFLSSWLTGRRGGYLATVISTALVWWYFVPPQHALFKSEFKHLIPAVVFIGMGVLFSEMNERLRHMTEQAARDNERIRALLVKNEEFDKLKNQFFANVSHELRTPLTMILGPVRDMLKRADLDKDAIRDLKVVERNACLLMRHVNDLLSITEYEAGQTELSYAETDVTHLARMLVSNFETVAQERGMTTVVDIPNGLRAQIDPEKTKKILLNILSNAFKFTPSGGHVRLSVRDEGNRIIFEIGDSGPGIPADKRDNLFDPFRQLNGGATRRHGGIGLGLAIAHDLVTSHHGSLSVTDAPEGGALFTVEMPKSAPPGVLVRPQADEMAELSDAKSVLEELKTRPVNTRPIETLGKAPLILVVEDNPDMNRFLCKILARDWRVAAASNGKEGVSLAVKLKPDLILSDIMMPEMSGDELVRELRSHRDLNDIPIVILSAKADDTLRMQLLREGVQDYLIKPFTVDELSTRIRNLLEAKKTLDLSHEALSRLESLGRSVEVVSESVSEMDWADLNKILRVILQEAQGLTGAEMAAFGIGTDPDKPFDPWIYNGVSDQVAQAIGRYPRPIGLLGAVSRGNQTMRIARVTAHPAMGPLPAHHPAITSFLGVPVPYRGQSIGTIYLANKLDAEEFTEEDQMMVEIFAARAGIAIETAKLYSNIKNVDRLREEWTTIIAHDLRQPVSVIKMAADSLEIDEKNLSEEAREMVRMIAANTVKLDRMIHDLLDVSQIELRRLKVKKRSEDLSTLIENAVATLRQMNPEREIILRESVVKPCRAFVDVQRIEQILDNLFSNAIKYSEKGTRIEIAFERVQDEYRISVANYGQGLTQNQIRHLFERFYRAPGSSRLAGGTGLGLFITRSLVQSHGGKIWAESVPGQKTAFTFSLPLAA